MNKQTGFRGFILDIASQTKNKSGISADIRKQTILPEINAWGFPKYPSRTKILPPSVNLLKELEKFIEENKQLLLEKSCFLGTWINPSTKYYYLDITTFVDDLREAKRLARKISLKEGRRIVAIYNAHLDKTVNLWRNVKE